MSLKDFRKRKMEIGSYFDISPVDIEKSQRVKVFHTFGKALYLSTCRSAIDKVLKTVSLKNKVALLPGFTCHAVVEPFVKNGFTVIPYFVKTSLAISIEDIEEKVKKYSPGIILVHDYFGFDSNKSIRECKLIEKLRAMGILIINDQTHSMLSSYKVHPSDYYLGSIRKWMAVPDGAYLKGVKDDCVYEPDNELEKNKIEAMIYKNNFLYKNVGNKEEMLANYKKAELILDSREIPYAISLTTKALLSIYNIDEIKKKRQENGTVLLNSINQNGHLYGPFERVENNEVPFYIPVFIKEKRKEFQTYMAHNGVFATIIWSCPEEYIGQINDETRKIYNEILCIPCDQRYCKDDMEYICNLINEFKWEN